MPASATVFISWSGFLSQQVALVLRDWLPCVIQAVEPYVSSEDIGKGTRWTDDVATRLEQSGFGILCLTPESVKSHWVLFEAGALSKMVGNAYVAPLLINIGRSLVISPLSQFQVTIPEKNDFLKLMITLNKAAGSLLSEIRLKQIYERWWPDLEGSIKSIIEADKTSDHENNQDVARDLHGLIEGRLNEIAASIFALQSTFNNPSSLIPKDYFLSLVGEAMIASSRSGLQTGDISYLTYWLDKTSEEMFSIRKSIESASKDPNDNKVFWELIEAYNSMATSFNNVRHALVERARIIPQSNFRGKLQLLSTSEHKRNFKKN